MKMKNVPSRASQYWVVPEILSEVEAVHEFEEKSEWVLSSGINPDE